MKKYICVLAVMVSIHCFAASVKEAALTLPAGWRFPNKSEAREVWRKKSNLNFLKVSADFDGDQIKDQSAVLVSIDGKRFGIFVWLGNNKQVPLEIFVNVEYAHLSSMGIDLFVKGFYKTACGKGYFDCKEGEPAELNLQNDSINFFKNESASSIFYWNPEQKKFIRTWMSD
jgi:hypothetical protein